MIALLLLILGLLIITPIVLAIIGIVFLCNSDSAVKKKGRNFLLAAVLLVLIEVLIGFSVCSNMNFH